MSQGMARQRIDREQNNIDQQHERAQAHSEFPIKVERQKNVLPQENQKQNREIQKISMDVLQNERKSGFALVVPLPFAHRTSRRILKERPIVCFSVVIAGRAKTQRPAQNQQRWRQLPPAMVLVNERRIKW